MSGIIAVYALVVAVLIAGNMKPPPATYSLFQGFCHLACGLSVGLTGLAAGYAIGIVGDSVGSKAIKGATSTEYQAKVGHDRAYEHTCSSRESLLEWCSF